MMFLRKLALGALVLLLLGASAPGPSPAAPERTVVVVLFDGFAPAELDAAKPTPNFDRLKREGAWSRHLVPAFPTISLINHTTFETGCWPEHHGIMSNIFYDPQKGLFANGHHEADADWRTGCESMWEAAERQGVKTAVFNWVGRWSTKRGKLSTFANADAPWSKRESNDTIVSKAIKLLHDTGPGHPRLIALYFDIPDHVAHFNGVTDRRQERPCAKRTPSPESSWQRSNRCPRAAKER
ncbi:MAG: ectonucleotide pyrophosphatase/phosphodiesterase [Rhizomicrobium sp.]